MKKNIKKELKIAAKYLHFLKNQDFLKDNVFASLYLSELELSIDEANTLKDTFLTKKSELYELKLELVNKTKLIAKMIKKSKKMEVVVNKENKIKKKLNKTK